MFREFELRLKLFSQSLKTIKGTPLIMEVQNASMF